MTKEQRITDLEANVIEQQSLIDELLKTTIEQEQSIKKLQSQLNSLTELVLTMGKVIETPRS